jgi:hypothetical protein
MSTNGRVLVDVEPDLVVVTPSNGTRDCLASRVAAAVVDLYPLVPDTHSDVIVTSHSDDEGCSPLDPLIAVLPSTEGSAYFLQLSILSQERAAELLADGGARRADFTFLPVADGDGAEQSGAYHLRIAGSDMLVAYRLEILG